MAEYFEFSSPENQGIKSEYIRDFASLLSSKGVCLHSLILVRNGRIIAEGYERHYDKDSLNRMYSVSKTFVSAAIGCLIGEGRLSLSDKVYKYFPDKYESRVHPYLEEATVENLLTMSTPFDDTTYRPDDRDWVKTFFTVKPSHRPGRVFNYDTSATLVLDAIVQKITGLDFTEYLYEKVLKHTGFDKAPACIREPGGVQWGGSGVLCTSRQLAAFADVFMRNGKSKDGRQLIPEEYVKSATSMQICNAVDNDCGPFRLKGYGYQVWITETGYAFLGMGNQLAICIPDKNLTVITTADDQGNSSARGYIFELLNEIILKNIEDNAGLPEGESLCLDEYLGMPLPCSPAPVNLQNEINGKEFRLIDNKNGFETLRFEFDGDKGRMCFRRKGENKAISFGINHYEDGVFPEIYSGMTIGTPAESGYRCTSAALWAEKDKLVLRCFIIDNYLGNFTANISFRGGKADVRFTKTAEWFLNEYTGYLSSI